jgi:kumamolisin
MSSRKHLFAIAGTVVGSLVVAQLSGIAQAQPPSPHHTVALAAVPRQLADHSTHLLGAVPNSQRLRLTVGLKTRHAAEQKKLLADLQNKKSPLFHKYLTAQQWNTRFGPTAANESAVVQWARSSGMTVSHRYSNRLLVDITTTAANAEAALHVKLNNYSLNGRTFFANTSTAQLPSSISSVVSSVDGLNNANQMVSASGMTDTASMPSYSPGPLSQAHAAAHANGSEKKLHSAIRANALHPNAAPGNYDPTDIYSSQAYDENALHNQTNCCNPAHVGTSSPAQSSIAIITAGSHFYSSDLAAWHTQYPYLAYSLNEYYIDGTPTSPDYEGTMDVEWALSLANSFGSFADTAHIYVYSGVNAAFTTFDDMYNKVLTNNTAKVVSSSWGCAESFCTPDATMNTDHAIFNAMSAQGFTMVNSSGDRGAYADCNSAHKSVSYPASDPDWLGIGATNLELTAGPVYSSQTAWGDVGNCSGNGGGSGGGCSAKYAAPSYQSSISSFCGTTAKAVPDVSLNGDWFNSPQNVYFNGAWSGNGGTSISAPMMAGFYAQQNSYGLELGNICGGGTAACAPMGQGGNQLYLAANSHGAQGKNPMYDVTSGCTTNEIGSGFCAITGYDRASGLGTPNMLQLAWADNYWSMPEASPPTVTLSGPTTNVYTNTGTISWNVVDNGSPASGVSGWTASWDADPGDPTSEATPGTGNSFYSGPQSAHGSTSGSASLASGGQGCHTLFVRAWDNIGESAVNSYGPVCFDDVAPVTSGTSVKLRTGQQLSGPDKTDVPVQFSWDPSADASSGVDHYNVWEKVGSGSFTQVASPTNTTFNVSLPAGHSYKFGVSATDKAGNVGAINYSNNVKLTVLQEKASGISYVKSWTRATDSSASGGKQELTSDNNAKSTYAFTGARTIAWVGQTGTGFGSAGVHIDSGSSTTVDSHASSGTHRVVLAALSSSGSGSHTFTINNQATSGHPKIAVDAIVVMTKS